MTSLNGVRVAMVSNELSNRAGGVVVPIGFLAKLLSKEYTANIEVLGACSLEEIDEALSASFVKKLHFVRVPKFTLMPSLKAALQFGNYSIVHSHGLWQQQSISVRSVCRKFGIPYIVSTHGMLDAWAFAKARTSKKLAWWAYEKRNLANSTCVHVLNKDELNSVRDSGYEGPIAVIPNGVEIPTEPRIERSKDKSKTLLFLSRINRKKGIFELIEAWHVLKAKGVLEADWKLQIVGWLDGIEADKISRCITAGDGRSSIEFSGPLFGEAKRQALENADAYILPSYSEGLPISVLEAWAYRLPVFVTEECNLAVGFEKQAAIRITRDPRELADTLGRWLGRDELALAGYAGYKLARDDFSWKSVGEKFAELYLWSLGKATEPDFVY